MISFKEQQAMARHRLALMREVIARGTGKYPYGDDMYLVNGRLVNQQEWERHCIRENRTIDRGIGLWN